LLKTVLAMALVAAVTTSARAADDLLVGTVNDRGGAPVVAADVRAYDAAGRETGRDATDRAGTFALHLTAAAATVEVRCSHCRTQRVRVGAGDLAIAIARYDALERTVPDDADLEALPYGRAVDVLALAPYVLPDGTSGVSDRGLGASHGLTVDDGAPLADLSTGSTALIDAPDRGVRALGIESATHAFRYGPGAGGGRFAIETLAPGARAILDTGPASALAVAGDAGGLRTGASLSDDAGRVARRADVDGVAALAGGTLRAGVSTGSERQSGYGGLRLARDVALAHADYATASRRYRTFAALSLAKVAVAFEPALATGVPANDAYRSTYASASFRLEKPGPIALAFGTVATLRDGTYGVRGPVSYDLTGRSLATTAYAEAHASGPTSIDAGFALVVASDRATLPATRRGSFVALVPSVEVRQTLGSGAYVRGAYSQSTRTPTLLEAEVAPPHGALFERRELVESALGYDGGGRVRAEAIAYREVARGLGASRLEGIGANVAWQATPLLSVRAWTLHTTPRDATRGVLWLSYENAARVRVDALLVRDASLGFARTSLDADVNVPLREGLTLWFDTARRGDARRYGIGARVR